MKQLAILTGAIMALIAPIASHQAFAQADAIKIVFPYAAGGSGDALSRMVATALQEATKKSVIVENRAGAAGRTGVKAVATSDPDGKTLLLTPIAPISVFPHVYGDQTGYDPAKQLAPVSQVATFDFSLAIANRVPAKTFKELVAWLKAHPDQMTFGSPGAGTLPYFFALLVGKAAGIELKHVSYRGSAAAMNDLVGGHVPIVVTTTADVVAQQKAGTVRVLATSEKQPFMPGIPTFKEAGYDISGTGWYAVYAPAGTPAATLDQYSRAISAYFQKADIKEKLVAMGLVASGTSGDGLAKIQKADSDLWGPVIKASGFRPKQ